MTGPLPKLVHGLAVWLLSRLSMPRCVRSHCCCACAALASAGVGISGQEGMQAVMASDFAIAQFRFLVPLLLVHGRYSYKRLSRMVLFFFYKNMLFGVTLFVFNAINAFSGQYIYSDVYMTLYNVVFTALTPIVIGMFDRDVDKAMGIKYPGLYRQGEGCGRAAAGWVALGDGVGLYFGTFRCWAKAHGGSTRRGDAWP